MTYKPWDSVDKDIKDDVGNTIYDYSTPEVPNGIVTALKNLGATDQFSAYPLSTTTDTDHSATDHEAGGSIEISLAGLGVGDDEKLYFGAGNIYSLRYDSAQDGLIVRHEPSGSEMRMI